MKTVEKLYQLKTSIQNYLTVWKVTFQSLGRQMLTKFTRQTCINKFGLCIEEQYFRNIMHVKPLKNCISTTRTCNCALAASATFCRCCCWARDRKRADRLDRADALVVICCSSIPSSFAPNASPVANTSKLSFRNFSWKQKVCSVFHQACLTIASSYLLLISSRSSS